MTQFVQFHTGRPQLLEEMGLNFRAITEILLFQSDSSVPELPASSPDWAKAYIPREYRASELTFRAVSECAMFTPHPITGIPTRSTGNFLCAVDGNSSLTLFKMFGDHSSGYYLAFTGLTGRVTHIVVPSRDCVVYDLDAANAPRVWHATQSNESDTLTDLNSPPKVGLVDMVSNFAHQAMNHLSGLERAISSGICNHLDEIWVLGPEFFGPVEDIFPELKEKIRRFDRHGAISRLHDTKYNAFKLGSNIVTAALRQRILTLAKVKAASKCLLCPRSPIVGFTIRSEGRRCHNLPDIIEEVVTTLTQMFPNLGVILDGWVFPEDAVVASSNSLTSLSKGYINRMLQEADLCVDIAKRLPPGVLVHNTVGTTLLESLGSLQSINAYVAHIGTLQHKLGWFTSAGGIVHGPTAELARMESATYSFQIGHPPASIKSTDVVDIPVDHPRGSGFFDYKIINASTIVQQLSDILIKCQSAR